VVHADEISKASEFDQQVRELELSISRFNLETDRMQIELDQQVSDIAALSDRLQGKGSNAEQQEHDWRRMVDVLQSMIQQDTTVHEKLVRDVTVIKETSLHMENELTLLNNKVGELIGNNGVQAHVLPMPTDWLPGGSASVNSVL
jgi:chromosome segregation ATPase